MWSLKPPSNNLYEVAQSSKDFTFLVEVLNSFPDLVEQLKGDKPLTLFAPINDAFIRFGDDRIRKLVANKDQLKRLLQYHIIEGKVVEDDIKTGKVKTLSGNEIFLEVKQGTAINYLTKVVYS